MLINGKNYTINRDTARVTKWDKMYCDTLKEILSEGELTPNRTGIDTLSIPHAYFKLDVGSEFPLLETKKVATKNAISELLWIYQAQSNDVSWLKERDNHIWDEWEIDKDGIWRIYDPYKNYNDGKSAELFDCFDNPLYDWDDSIMKVKSLKPDKSIKDAIYFGKEYAGTIGEAYGFVVNETGEFDNVLKSLKENPRNRRMVVSLRQAANLKKGVLEPCVWAHTYKLYKGRLNSNVTIRSNDMPLGNPFNVTQYSVLLSLLAKEADFKVGEISFDIADCHIYVNQLDGIKLQLKRYDNLVKWADFIKAHSDEAIEFAYNELIKKRDYLNRTISREDSKEAKNSLLTEIEEEIMAIEHLITREDPELYINPDKSFYDYDNRKDNDDIKVLKYTSLPFIKMPVAQ